MNLSFTTDIDPKKTIDFLAGPRLWISKSAYPDFSCWLDKVKIELGGVKHGVFCYVGTTLMGAAIYQRHKTCPTVLEVKNLTVHPGVGRRFVASFLLRNAEVEGREKFGLNQAMADSKKSNLAVDALLVRNGYRVVSTMDLYGLKAGEDNVYLKELGN